VSSVSNGLYFLALPLVSVMRAIKRNIEKVWGVHYTLGARYLYVIRDAEKVCGARYTLGARYLPKNTVYRLPVIVFGINPYQSSKCECYFFLLKDQLQSSFMITAVYCNKPEPHW
jgi:hypothetical protein